MYNFFLVYLEVSLDKKTPVLQVYPVLSSFRDFNRHFLRMRNKHNMSLICILDFYQYQIKLELKTLKTEIKNNNLIK